VYIAIPYIRVHDPDRVYIATPMR